MGNGLSGLFGQQAGSGGASKCPPSGCEVRKRNLFESNVEEWNSTLVIAYVFLGLLLLVAVFVRGRRRCRNSTDMESKALHSAVKPPVEDGENMKGKTMLVPVEVAPSD